MQPIFLRDFLISDDDIDWVETLLENIKFDTCRRDIIKNLTSVDIQACPGSGKTTVLVAKLAILAKKWPFSHKGLCVLSHTNTAREEIQNRLGRTSIGRTLLAYPHFIGTIDSFCSQFVGMPWIRSLGMPVSIIDYNIVLENRFRHLLYGTQIYLEKKLMYEKGCEAISLPSTPQINCGPETQTYKDIVNTIERSHQQGEFTFKEMLLYSQDAFEKCSSLPEIIQTRFPILFVDEAQDTNKLQWELLIKAFPERSNYCIRQAFGDVNQAIFSSYTSDEASNIFPRMDPLVIENSKRFDSTIAAFANSLSLKQTGMKGENQEFAKNVGKHTIFVFSKDRINSVIPAYAKHLLSCFSDDELEKNKKYGCHVVGMVHKKSEHSADNMKNHPSSLCDYWECYNPEAAGVYASLHYLIDYFRLAKASLYGKHDLNVLIDWIAKGLKRYIMINSSHRISTTNNHFRAIIDEFSKEKQPQVRKVMQALAYANIDDETHWNVVRNNVHSLLDHQFEIHKVDHNFLCWKDSNVGAELETHNANTINVYHYENPENSRSIDLQLGSIHSVKGQTHLATLVVETFWHDPNIRSILGWICCSGNKEVKVRNATRLKCHYVALSRAKGLVCFAIPIDSVDENAVSKLKAQGWNIEYV